MIEVGYSVFAAAFLSSLTGLVSFPDWTRAMNRWAIGFRPGGTRGGQRIGFVEVSPG